MFIEEQNGAKYTSRKTDRKGKGKASAIISTSANRVLAGHVAPREIASSFSSNTIQDQQYMEIVEMFNKVNNSINGVKDDIAAVNSNMTAFKNRMGVVVDTSGKTHTAFADFATACANNQTHMASLGPSLIQPMSPRPPSEIFAEKLWDWKFESDDPALVAKNESKKKWNLNKKINHRNNNRYKHSHRTFHESPEQKVKKNSKGRAKSRTLQTGNPVEKAYLKLFQKDVISDGESDIEIVDNLLQWYLHFNRLLTMVDDIDCAHHVSNVGMGTKPRMNRYPTILLPCSVSATLSQSLPRWAINDE
ncbi:hypothetical protein PHYBLDRAFT_146934 [Phycomyces blakesleeanus NRRL 1555(-)]|uniref:Uncharacterized protein n=1 Tax=Phycomyces blakesleeanus (strain ATCC 8743b / DSM 1359 / FGSC 10004 / NBRC 33097 / NRRL 1555) TaxID=763407 RepID=A0A167M6I3_PHYB8|nr:hypothetical protein PHYBLDRAFT_146934 [Phycomyces blakesleeanus NRRL 1555(-)]OAD71949.1 hypothetical protein PHYBLDRAFT_146934 [Phycomyces blakesleeanus NRRL 1555(-)]|eukprot:XP_018289989.1 hypothetical protein PHYBLDRAFT_146934 [Phycomyces blakesleeanus NRRL 1555(-)]